MKCSDDATGTTRETKTPPSSSDLSKNDHARAATSCLPLPAAWLPRHGWPKHHYFIFWPFWLPELAHCALTKAPVLLQGGQRGHMALMKRTAQAQSHVPTTGQGSRGGNRAGLGLTRCTTHGSHSGSVPWAHPQPPPLQLVQATSARDLALTKPTQARKNHKWHLPPKIGGKKKRD